MSFQDQLKFRLAQKQKAEEEGQESPAPPSPTKQKDEGMNLQDQLKNRLNKRQTCNLKMTIVRAEEEPVTSPKVAAKPSAPPVP